jgi:hypothetical protein
MSDDSPLPLETQGYEDPMEPVTQRFTVVTLVVVDKPPGKPTVKPPTPRTYDEDPNCYFVTTHSKSSDDKRTGGKPPEQEQSHNAQNRAVAESVVAHLTCDKQSLCTRSRRKQNETFIQTISTGTPG